MTRKLKKAAENSAAFLVLIGQRRNEFSAYRERRRAVFGVEGGKVGLRIAVSYKLGRAAPDMARAVEIEPEPVLDQRGPGNKA